MMFLTVWELALFCIFMIELADDFIWIHTKFDIYQYDLTRVSIVFAIYFSGLVLGKVRFHWVFILLLYILIGSAYIFVDYDFVKVINCFKIVVLFFVATLSPSHDYKTNGPYGVGYREFKLPSGRQACVSVYYPIDKAQYEKYKDNTSKNIARMRDGSKTARGIGIGVGIFPNIMFKYYTQERIQVVKDHPLHKDFTEGDKKLLPVFFSHGLIINRTNYSGMCRELASYGCIVYAFDHTDGSCSYFLDTTSVPPKEVYYTEYDEKKHKCTAEEYRLSQINLRMDDVQNLIEYLNFVEIKIIPSIDISKLSFCGHSYGGYTSIEACSRFSNDFKYCVAIDPVFRSRLAENSNQKSLYISQPLLQFRNEYFTDKDMRVW